MAVPPPQTPRVVFITGASAGIGRETALAFARRGERVGAVARRPDRLEALAAEAQSLPGEIFPQVADVCDPEALARVVGEIMARWGRLDVLVANAGIGQRGAIVDSAWADLDVVLRTNIDGVLHSVRAAVPAMRTTSREAGGHILLISSIVGATTTPYATVYAASKAALNAVARGLRVELAPDRIWVTNMLIGRTHSEFAAARRGQAGRVRALLPTMQPDHVARCIVRESTRRRRTVTLRWLDRAIVAGGVFLPWLTDRLAARMYGPR